MEVFSSSEARNNFAALWEKAKKAPVAIQKQGREEMILLSREAYDRHQKNKNRKLSRSEMESILAEEEEAQHTKAIQRFHEAAERMRRTAKKNGMTQKIFDEIMAQDD